MKNIKIFSGSSYPALTRKVCRKLGIELSPSAIHTYNSTGCFEYQLLDDVKGKNVYLFQTFLPDLNKNHRQIWESLEAIDAACLNEATNVTLVATYVPYGRSDKVPGDPKFLAGTDTALELLIRCWKAAGLNRTIVVEPHSEKFADIFTRFFPEYGAFYEINPINLVISKIKSEISRDSENSILLTPDKGALKRNVDFQKKLGVRMLCAEKNRKKDNEVQSIRKNWGVEDTEGKKIYFCDDEISTGGTVKTTLNGLKASENTIIATHGVFSDKALENLQQIENLKEIIVTDTLPVSAEIKDALPVEIISVAGMIAEAIEVTEREIIEKKYRDER